MAIIHLTKELFEKRVALIGLHSTSFKFLGSRPALIDFYADWCTPCQMLAPILAELSEEFDGKVDFYKINVDEENELSSHFAIRSIPTLIFVPVNGAMQRSTGAITKSRLREIIEKVLLEEN